MIYLFSRISFRKASIAASSVVAVLIMVMPTTTLAVGTGGLGCIARGTPCTSPANSCGQTNSGQLDCDSTCTGTATLCVTAANTAYCDDGIHETLVQPPANPANYGATCQSTANVCGIRNTGSIQCNETCSASAPPNTSCGTITGGTCSASPASPPINTSVTWSTTGATGAVGTASNYQWQPGLPFQSSEEVCTGSQYDYVANCPGSPPVSGNGFTGTSCTGDENQQCTAIQNPPVCTSSGGSIFRVVSVFSCNPTTFTAPTYTYSWSGDNGLTGALSSATLAGGYPLASTLYHALVVISSPTASSQNVSCRVTTSAPAPLPDLVPNPLASGLNLTLPGSATMGTPINVTASYTNQGTAATSANFPNLFEFYPSASAPSPALTFAQLQSGGLVVAGATSPAIGAGLPGNVTLSNFNSFSGSGSWQVRGCANTDTNGATPAAVGGTSESLYNNNCGNWMPLTVNAAATPTAVCGAYPTSVTVGSPTTWYSSASGGAGAPYTYSWSLGGATLVNPSTLTSQNPQVTYASANTYSGTLTVTDKNGVSSSPISCAGGIVTGAPGSTVSPVTVTPPLVNGACAATHYNCTAGTSANNVSGASTWTWDCDGTGGGSNALGCSEAKAAATATITAAPPKVNSGGTTVLTYSASGVTSCSIISTGTAVSGPGCSPVVSGGSTNGTCTTPPITGQTQYTLSCTGAMANASVIVNLLPGFTVF